jgi:hypothetical protein
MRNALSVDELGVPAMRLSDLAKGTAEKGRRRGHALSG